MSSIDRVLVRAAASSIASGRPSSDSHSSRSAPSLSLDARSTALCAGSPGEQLHGVGEPEGREVEHDLAVDVERQPGWCTGRARRRCASMRRTARSEAASRTCSQLSRITSESAPLRRSNSAASPPTFSAAMSVSTTSFGVTAVSRRASHTPPAGASFDEANARADGDRDGGLADPARPDDLDQPLPGEKVGHRGHLGLAADELGRHRRAGSPWPRDPARASSDSSAPSVASWARIWCSSCWSCGPGSRPSSSASVRPDSLVGREGIGLTSGAIQRGDQQLPQALLIGVRHHGRFQLADHVAELAEARGARRELRFDQ